MKLKDLWNNFAFPGKRSRDGYIIRDKNLRVHYDRYIYETYQKTLRDDADSSEWERILLALDIVIGPQNFILLPHYCILHSAMNFMIPYIALYLFLGIPLYYVEFSLAKITKLGPDRLYTFMNPLYRGVTVAIYLVGLIQTVVFAVYGMKFFEMASLEFYNIHHVELDIDNYKWTNSYLIEDCITRDMGCFESHNYTHCHQHPFHRDCDSLWTYAEVLYTRKKVGFTPVYQYNLMHETITHPASYQTDLEPVPMTYYVFWAFVILMSLETAYYVAKFTIILKFFAVVFLASCARTAYYSKGGEVANDLFSYLEAQRTFDDVLWPNAIAMVVFSLGCCTGFIHKLGSISKRRSKTATKTLITIFAVDIVVKCIVMVMFYSAASVVGSNIYSYWTDPGGPVRGVTNYMRHGTILTLVAFPEYKFWDTEKFLQFNRTTIMFYFLIMMLFCARHCSLYLLQLLSLLVNAASVRVLCRDISSTLNRTVLTIASGVFLAAITIGFTFPSTFIPIIALQMGMVTAILSIVVAEFMIIGYAYPFKDFLCDVDFYKSRLAKVMYWPVVVLILIVIPAFSVTTCICHLCDRTIPQYAEYVYNKNVLAIKYILPILVILVLNPFMYIWCQKTRPNWRTMFRNSKEWVEREQIVRRDKKNVEALDYAERLFQHVAGNSPQSESEEKITQEPERSYGFTKDGSGSGSGEDNKRSVYADVMLDGRSAEKKKDEKEEKVTKKEKKLPESQRKSSRNGRESSRNRKETNKNRKERNKNGKEGKESTRNVQESSRNAQESSRNARESTRNARESHRNGKESTRNARESIRNGKSNDKTKMKKQKEEKKPQKEPQYGNEDTATEHDKQKQEKKKEKDEKKEEQEEEPASEEAPMEHEKPQKEKMDKADTTQRDLKKESARPVFKAPPTKAAPTKKPPNQAEDPAPGEKTDKASSTTSKNPTRKSSGVVSSKASSKRPPPRKPTPVKTLGKSTEDFEAALNNDKEPAPSSPTEWKSPHEESFKSPSGFE